MSQVARINDRIFVLTDVVEIDERITWHIPGARGYEPYNEYLILSDDRALLIDSGVALHGSSILSSLKELIGSRELILYSTRIELECMGNHGLIINEFPNSQIVTANVVPQAALFHVSGFRSTTAPETHMRMGESLEDFGFPEIQILQAPLRMLGTSWLWESRSRTLFTTDSFNIDMFDSPDEPVFRSHSDAIPRPELIRQTLLQKFDWLALADMDMIRSDWDLLFQRVTPTAIAPIHGRIQIGDEHCQNVIVSFANALFPDAC